MGAEGARQMSDRAARALADWRHERPALSAPIQRIRTRLVLLGATINRDNHLLAQKYGITGPEMRILYALRRSGAPYQLRPTELQEALLVPSATVTRQVDRLVGLGAVRRIAETQDRRSNLVHLTEEGLSIADAALTEGVNHSALSSALRELPADDQQSLDRILQKLLSSPAVTR